MLMYLIVFIRKGFALVQLKQIICLDFILGRIINVCYCEHSALILLVLILNNMFLLGCAYLSTGRRARK